MEKYLEVVEAKSNVNRMTANPKTGRFTLKISEGVDVSFRHSLIKFAKRIINELDENFKTTLRGEIEWLEDYKMLFCHLQSESKKESTTFNYREE